MIATLWVVLSIAARASAAAPGPGLEQGWIDLAKPPEVRREGGERIVYLDGFKLNDLVGELSSGLRDMESRMRELQQDPGASRVELEQLRQEHQTTREYYQKFNAIMDRALAEAPEGVPGGSRGQGEGSAAAALAGADAGPTRTGDDGGAGRAGADRPGGASRGSGGGRGVEMLSQGRVKGAGMARAMGSAERMRGALGAFGGMPGGTAAGGVSAQGAGVPAGGPRRGPEDELALAALPAYRGALERVGLSVGAGPGGGRAIVRKDGSPASQVELAALRAGLAAQPQALLKRVDFFDVIKREDFDRLKRVHQERPELGRTVLRDMGVSESGNDLVWTRSCAMVSGECNPAAGGMSYRKGEFVQPEDLQAAAEEVAREMGAEAGSGEEESAEEPPGFKELMAAIDESAAAVFDKAVAETEASSSGAPAGIGGLLARAGKRVAGSLLAGARSLLGQEADSAGPRVETARAGGAAAGPGPRGARAKAAADAIRRWDTGAVAGGRSRRRLAIWLPIVAVAAALIIIGLRGKAS
ncbi:MAG: hypothetical protein HY927_15960 [Elusimicrobia bacterium]|nr:hypothetical protein [Elusimicrobiota bacterium]